MTLATALLAALLALFPAMSRGCRPCIVSHQAAIVRELDAGEALGVPPAILLAVGFLESHLGCDPASGGCWGAPIDPQHRHIAGAPSATTRALVTSRRVCGTWPRALARFRCGLCAGCPRLRGYTPAQALSLAARIEARAGVQ